MRCRLHSEFSCSWNAAPESIQSESSADETSDAGYIRQERRHLVQTETGWPFICHYQTDSCSDAKLFVIS
jgi:hypothetical protein